MSTFTGAVSGSWTGTNGFRMYPHEEFSTAESSAVVTAVAGGTGVSVAYTWVHPTDGPQSGFLVIGEPGEDGTVTAALLDSWHQRTGPATLTGTRTEADPAERVHVEYDYGQGWLWRIRLEPVFAGDGTDLAMTMSNVVPEGVEGAPAGAYEVMTARWTRG